jgi:hypothetical protein
VEDKRPGRRAERVLLLEHDPLLLYDGRGGNRGRRGRRSWALVQFSDPCSSHCPSRSSRDPSRRRARRRRPHAARTAPWSSRPRTGAFGCRWHGGSEPREQRSTGHSPPSLWAAGPSQLVTIGSLRGRRVRLTGS